MKGEKNAADPGNPGPQTPGLEGALTRIEALVAEMERGDLPLETLIERFEEGAKLVKTCQEKLDACEKRIQLIVKENGVANAVVDFDESE